MKLIEHTYLGKLLFHSSYQNCIQVMNHTLYEFIAGLIKQDVLYYKQLTICNEIKTIIFNL